MNHRAFCLLAAGVTLISGPIAVGQPRPNAADLPIKQIVLFSSGVGYFQREGQVDNHTRIDLQFPAQNINDLLKSMVLEDRGGGSIATVNYDNRNPIEMTLKSFAVDLTSNPSMGDLLNQVRGEQIEIVTTGDTKASVVAAETISGLIVGVEKQKHTVGKDQVVESSQLNILTREGLRGVPLGQILRVRFMKAGLEQEFRKALEVLATGHDKLKKTVSLNFSGSGKRAVKVGYISESPIWKTSYRLAVRHVEKGKDEFILQGWAIIENTTDDDWNNVQMGLVSGRPISFQMDLYQPLFIKRPTVELELFASLRPQMYGGNLYADKAPPPAEMPAPTSPAMGGGGGFGGMGRPMAPARAGKPAGEESRLVRSLSDARAKGGIALGKEVETAAVTTDLGEYFEYFIKQPVSLPRQKSALLPIVNEEVQGRKVSIYNQGVHSKFPLLGMRFTNSTPLHLSQGPITVFENNTYAGDAQIGDLQPKESRLISYAIDLGTEVDPQQKESEDLLKIKLIKGIVHSEFIHKETRTYRIKNRSDNSRSLLIEHPFRNGFELVLPKKPTERSRDYYRFEVKAEPNQPLDFVVEERLPHFTQVALSNNNDESVRILIRSHASSPAVKEALQRALELKAKFDAALQDIAREDRALKVIEQDQVRMRANMERVPQTSEAYKRYLKKFDDQETEIERLRARITQLQEKLEQERKAYETYLANLSVE